MGEFLEYFKEKKNLANLLILGILILALPLGINLVRQQQILNSRADVVPITFKGDNVVTKNGQLIALAPQVTLELISPLGSPAKVAGTQIVRWGGLVKTAYAEGDLYPCNRPNQVQIGEINPNYNCSADANGCIGTAYATYTDYTTDEDGDGIADPANPGDQPWCDNTCGEPKTCPPTPTDDTWCTGRPGVFPCTDADMWPTGHGSCKKAGQTCTQYYKYECTTSTDISYCSKSQAECDIPCTDSSPSPSPSASVSPKPSVSPGSSVSPSPSVPAGCDLGSNMFGMTDACAACVLEGSGNPKLVDDIKNLGTRYGNKWGSCGNTALIGKWCADINKPACDTIKATPECVSACGGTQEACPAGITSTQAKIRASERGTWTTSMSINLGDNVFVAGFHNQQIEKVADDIILTSTGPEGPDSHVQTLVMEANIATYKPSQPGKYTIKATTSGKTGQNCTGSATLTVSVPAVTTTHFRVAENAADLEGAPWETYTDEPMTKAYGFKDITPGEKTIFVEFKDSKGKIGGCGQNNSKACNAKIRLLGSDPAITGCSLNFEGVNTIFTITGTNFGSTRGTVKSGETTLGIRDWKDGRVSAMWTNTPSGQVIPVTLTNTDSQSGEGLCGATSQLSLGARVFCRQPANQDTDNVDLTLVGAFEGGEKIKQKVKLDKDGLIPALNQKLEAGKQYILSIKAPRSLRKTSLPFTAGGGITSLANFVLPVGDIFPAGEGDGAINTLDKGELNRQWIIAASANSRTGDFNRDSRVNSLDWACMRHDFGKIDDPEPSPGAPSGELNPGSSPIPSPSVSPSPSPSPVSSAGQEF